MEPLKWTKISICGLAVRPLAPKSQDALRAASSLGLSGHPSPSCSNNTSTTSTSTAPSWSRASTPGGAGKSRRQSLVAARRRRTGVSSFSMGDVDFRDVAKPTFSCEVKVVGGQAGRKLPKTPVQKCQVEFISSDFISLDTCTTCATVFIRTSILQVLVQAKACLELLVFVDKAEGTWLSSLGLKKKPIGVQRIPITQDWLKFTGTFQAYSRWSPLGQLNAKEVTPAQHEQHEQHEQQQQQQPWVRQMRAGERQEMLELHATVRLEHDPRYVMRFESRACGSPNIVQVCGSSQQPAFNCRFQKEQPNETHNSFSRFQSESEDDYVVPPLPSISCFLNPNLIRKPTVEMKRDGWNLTVYGLSGSPVAMASMVTPFVSSGSTAGIKPSFSASGAWLIMFPVVAGGPWQHWGRLEVNREPSQPSLSCRFLLSQEDFFDSEETIESLVTRSSISCKEGGTLALGLSVCYKSSHPTQHHSSFQKSPRSGASSFSGSNPTTPSSAAYSIAAWSTASTSISASFYASSTSSSYNHPVSPSTAAFCPPLHPNQVAASLSSYPSPLAVSLASPKSFRLDSLPSPLGVSFPAAHCPSPYLLSPIPLDLPQTSHGERSRGGSRSTNVSPRPSTAEGTNRRRNHLSQSQYTEATSRDKDKDRERDRPPTPSSSFGIPQSSPSFWSHSSLTKTSTRPSSPSRGMPPLPHHNRRLRSKSLSSVPIPDDLVVTSGAMEGHDLPWNHGGHEPSSNAYLNQEAAKMRSRSLVERVGASEREPDVARKSVGQGGRREGSFRSSLNRWSETKEGGDGEVNSPTGVETDKFLVNIHVQRASKGFVSSLEVASRHVKHIDDIGVYLALAGALELSLDLCQPSSKWTRR